MSKRFKKDCSELHEAAEYYRNRAIQILMDGFMFDAEHGVIPVVDEFGIEWGAKARFQHWNQNSGYGLKYTSVYVYDQFRGQQRLKNWLLGNSMNYMITSPDCKMESFFKHVLSRYSDVFIVAARFTETKEYQAAERIFGHKKAERSKQWYMNHIDEGLFVLNYLGASEKAKKAFCLHPIVQMDEELAKNYSEISNLSDEPDVVALAMEYRSVANEYLSKRKLSDSKRIRLSPLKEVNDMLIADKIQNYKDFLLYHKDTHPKSNELNFYFQNWFRRLGVSMETFELIRNLITVP